MRLGLMMLSSVAVLAATLTISAAQSSLNAQSVTGFTGSVPGPNEIGLLVTSEQKTPADLALALQASGCAPAVLATLPDGTWRTYVPGAPSYVNAGFPAVLEAATPFFVRCAGATSGSPTDGSTRMWEGSGAGSVGPFAIGSGAWEYCADILSNPDANSGVRFSLYTQTGLWVSSDSGKGGPGTVGCTPIPQSSERFEIRIFALEGLRWSVTVQPVGSAPVAPELPLWPSAPAAISPYAIDSEGVWFSSDHMEVTELFRVHSNQLLYCYELISSQTDTSQTTQPFLSFSILFEDEPGRVAEYRASGDELEPGAALCLEVTVPQPGRYRLLVNDGVPGTAWVILVVGATAG